MPWYDTYGDDKVWYDDGEVPWKSKEPKVPVPFYWSIASIWRVHGLREALRILLHRLFERS